MQSVFSWAPWAPKVARKCESKHWYAFGAEGQSLGWSVYGHVITKFSRMGNLPRFLPMVLRRRASRARAPLRKGQYFKYDILLSFNKPFGRQVFSRENEMKVLLYIYQESLLPSSILVVNN